MLYLRVYLLTVLQGLSLLVFLLYAEFPIAAFLSGAVGIALAYNSLMPLCDDDKLTRVKQLLVGAPLAVAHFAVLMAMLVIVKRLDLDLYHLAGIGLVVFVLSLINFEFRPKGTPWWSGFWGPQACR